jgi:hypothetical protein
MRYGSNSTRERPRERKGETDEIYLPNRHVAGGCLDANGDGREDRTGNDARQNVEGRAVEPFRPPIWFFM